MTMGAKFNGGPAFPRPFSETGDATQGAIFYSQSGMTLRDYFAAKAMQALIGCVCERTGDSNLIIDNDGHVSLHVRAYEHADAMLAATVYSS